MNISFFSFIYFWPWHVAYTILVPQLVIEPGPLQWKHQIQTTGPPGNSQIFLIWGKKMSQNSGCNVDTGRSLGDGCNWKGQTEYLSDILADMSRKEFFTLGYGSGSGSDDKGRSLENQGESPTPLPNPRVPWHMGELPAMTYKSCVGEKNQNSAKVMNAGNILVKSFGVSGQHSACVPSQQTYLVYSHSSESPDCSPSLGHH